MAETKMNLYLHCEKTDRWVNSKKIGVYDRVVTRKSKVNAKMRRQIKYVHLFTLFHVSNYQVSFRFTENMLNLFRDKKTKQLHEYFPRFDLLHIQWLNFINIFDIVSVCTHKSCQRLKINEMRHSIH